MNHLDINVDIMKGYNKMKFDRNQKTGLNAIKHLIIQNKILQQKKLLEKRDRLEEKKPEILEENIQKPKTPIQHSTKYNIIKKGQVVMK
jgi:hypothetical protein